MQYPGCGVANHNDACLCDVRIASPCPINTAVEHPFVAMTMKSLKGRGDQASIEFWCQMLHVWERSKELGVGPYLSFQQLGDLASEWQFTQGVIDGDAGMLKQSTTSFKANAKATDRHKRVCRVMRARQHKVLIQLRQAGFTVEACARFLTTDEQYVNRLLARDEKKLLAIKAVKEGKSVLAASKEVGLNEATVRRYARQAGVKRECAGTKYTAAQYAAVLAMYEQGGYTRRQIADQLGVGYHAVNGIVRRRAKSYPGKSRQVAGLLVGVEA